MLPREAVSTSSSSTVREIEVRVADGLILKGRWWRRQAPRAAIIVSHGFSEHGGTYRHVADTLSHALDVDVVIVDFRGHGTSPGRRGVVRRYEELTDDLTGVVEWVGRQRPDLRRFLLGHSNGGQVVLRFALENRIPVEALILSNPALRVALPIPPHKLRLGKLLRKYAPWVTLGGELRTEFLTRDPEFQQAHRNDALRHNRMSAPLFFGMLEGGEMLLARACEIHTPTLMIVGGQDPIVDPSAARELFDRLGSEDKMLLYYPKMLHEPFNEVGRDQVFDDVIRWLEPRLRS
jgi:alpha-beta hydrolase superfamily lysophospholipase